MSNFYLYIPFLFREICVCVYIYIYICIRVLGLVLVDLFFFVSSLVETIASQDGSS